MLIAARSPGSPTGHIAAVACCRDVLPLCRRPGSPQEMGVLFPGRGIVNVLHFKTCSVIARSRRISPSSKGVPSGRKRSWNQTFGSGLPNLDPQG